MTRFSHFGVVSFVVMSCDNSKSYWNGARLYSMKPQFNPNTVYLSIEHESLHICPFNETLNMTLKSHILFIKQANRVNRS